MEDIKTVDKEYFKTGYELLRMAFVTRKFILTEEEINGWAMFFENTRQDDFIRGIKMYINQYSYLPTIHAIKKCILKCKEAREKYEEKKRFVPPEKRTVIYYE